MDKLEDPTLLQPTQAEVVPLCNQWLGEKHALPPFVMLSKAKQLHAWVAYADSSLRSEGQEEVPHAVLRWQRSTALLFL